MGLINVSNLPRSNFLAIDEGWGTMDSDNLNSVYQLFQYLKSQFQFTLIVSHIDTMRDAVDSLVEITKHKNYSNVNIAGAESLPTADSFRQYLEKNTFDIIQFDIATSGFTEGKKIASVSSFYQKPLAIHSWGTIISILSGIHMALAASNCVYTEFGFMDHPFNGYLSNEEYQVHDGFFNAKQLGSGLGVRFDDQMEKLFPYNPSKINSMISFEETFNAL